MGSIAGKIGSIIALIDQLDNSITICVIQMVFNFPQRYLYFPIYISFVRNCLAPLPSPPPTSNPSIPTHFRPWCWFISIFLFFFFSFPSLFFSRVGHLKTAVFRICISLTFLRYLFPWNSIVRAWNCIYWHIEIQLTLSWNLITWNVVPKMLYVRKRCFENSMR